MIIDINEMTYCDNCGEVKDESELHVVLCESPVVVHCDDC